MATLTVTPAQGLVGQILVVDGDDFLATTKVSIRVHEQGSQFELTSDIISDAGGSFSSSDEADPAIGTLTSDATIPTADDTVTIDGVVYTFKAAPTTVAGEVKLGASAAEALANLKAAINLDAGAGTLYGSLTVVHPTVRATTLTATTLKVVAKTGGTAGNALATTEGSTHLSWGGVTLAGGAAATASVPFRVIPSVPGLWKFSATDGTNTATAEARVFAGG